MKQLQQRSREAMTFKPIGAAFAAVVAGVAPGALAAEPAVHGEHVRAHAEDPTNDPRRDEDPALLLGPGEPVEPFSEPAAPKQGDLFDL